MPLNLSQDYLVFDGYEAVTYQRTTLADGNLDTVSHALRRSPSAREASPSGGAYTATDLDWVIPKAVLIQGMAPKVGDVVIDGDSSRWTVLNAAFWAMQNTWRLQCRNLTLHYDLRHRVDIERPGISFDNAGVAVKQFPPSGGRVAYGDLPCRVQLLSQEIANERGLRGFQGTHAVIVDRQVAVTNDDRVKWVENGVTYYLDIVGYHDAQRIDSLPVIDAQLRV